MYSNQEENPMFVCKPRSAGAVELMQRQREGYAYIRP